MTVTRKCASRWWPGAVILLLLAACQSKAAPQPAPATAAPASGPGAAASPNAATSARPRIVILGDSLTAGLGLSKREAFPALVQQRIDAAGYGYDVVDAGVSGDTSAGGLSRLDWSLDGNVRVLVVALGGNDGLRGLPVTEMTRNLGEIIRRAQSRGIAVMLAGMESPTNMGPDYQREFHDAFPALARQYRVAFLPFLLEGVAGRPDLNQHDGIHPTAEGARVIADHVWQVLQPMLRTGAH
ncbi:MAG: arylesterase [Bacteroidales bacterium]